MVCRNSSNQVAGLLLSSWCNKGSSARSFYLTPFLFSLSLWRLFNDVAVVCVYRECLNAATAALMNTRCISPPPFVHILLLESLSCTYRNARTHSHTLVCTVSGITMSLVCILSVPPPSPSIVCIVHQNSFAKRENMFVWD